MHIIHDITDINILHTDLYFMFHCDEKSFATEFLTTF